MLGFTLLQEAQAETWCSDLDDIIDDARSSFVGADGPELGTFAPAPDRCELAAEPSGSDVYRCTWSFALRAAETAEVYNGLAVSVAECVGGDVLPVVDRGVNHPDTSLRHTYDLGSAALSLSLKDKSALDASYVFLEVRGDQADEGADNVP